MYHRIYLEKNKMMKILLGSGKYTIVDDVDYDWLNQYMWKLDGYGYVINATYRSELCNTPCSPISSMSRMILELEYGDKRQADHINHNILDNRRSNLRVATIAENQHNQKIRSGGTSQYKGVYWNKRNKKWHVKIKINNKAKYLGQFSKEKYAAQAYNLAAKRYFGNFAYLNKIA